MELFYRERGEGEPVVLLHGLFGSSDNVGGIARNLEEDFRVISFDLRNHGRSPHTDTMSYPEMAADVVAMLDRIGVEQFFLFGHSMGGKVAMQLTLDNPKRVKKLIVADIAPVKYSHDHRVILKGLRAVANSDASSRSDAQAILAPYVEERDVLSFLLTNWRRGKDGQPGWRIGLDAIEHDYANIVAANSGQAVDVPVLFLRGGLSDYIKPEHRDATLALFPNAIVRTVEGTGHWLHAEKPDLVSRLVARFIKNEL